MDDYLSIVRPDKQRNPHEEPFSNHLFFCSALILRLMTRNLTFPKWTHPPHWRVFSMRWRTCYSLTAVLHNTAPVYSNLTAAFVLSFGCSAAGGRGGRICVGGHLRAEHRQYGCSLLWNIVSGQLWQWRPSAPQTVCTHTHTQSLSSAAAT